jgi:hypothetical protein
MDSFQNWHFLHELPSWTHPYHRQEAILCKQDKLRNVDPPNKKAQRKILKRPAINFADNSLPVAKKSSQAGHSLEQLPKVTTKN